MRRYCWAMGSSRIRSSVKEWMRTVRNQTGRNIQWTIRIMLENWKRRKSPLERSWRIWERRRAGENGTNGIATESLWIYLAATKWMHKCYHGLEFFTVRPEDRTTVVNASRRQTKEGEDVQIENKVLQKSAIHLVWWKARTSAKQWRTR